MVDSLGARAVHLILVVRAGHSVAGCASRGSDACRRRPGAQWIWVDAYPRRGQTARFRCEFYVEGQPRKAELSGLADDRMTVYLNGVEVAQIADTKREAPVDVAEHSQGRTEPAVRGSAQCPRSGWHPAAAEDR